MESAFFQYVTFLNPYGLRVPDEIGPSVPLQLWRVMTALGAKALSTFITGRKVQCFNPFHARAFTPRILHRFLCKHPMQPAEVRPSVTLARCAQSRQESPDFAENFAAHAFLPGLLAGHHPPRSGENVDAKTTLDTLDLIPTNIDTATRTGNTGEVPDGSLVVCPILQVHAQNSPAIFLRGLVVGDIALFLKDAGNLRLQL